MEVSIYIFSNSEGSPYQVSENYRWRNYHLPLKGVGLRESYVSAGADDAVDTTLQPIGALTSLDVDRLPKC